MSQSAKDLVQQAGNKLPPDATVEEAYLSPESRSTNRDVDVRMDLSTQAGGPRNA